MEEPGFYSIHLPTSPLHRSIDLLRPFARPFRMFHILLIVFHFFIVEQNIGRFKLCENKAQE